MTETIVTEMPGADSHVPKVFAQTPASGAPRSLNLRGIHAAYLVACALADAEGVLSGAPPLGSRPVGEQQRYLRAAKVALAGLWGHTWARACHSIDATVRADLADLDLADIWGPSQAQQIEAIAVDAAEAALAVYDGHLVAAFDQAVR